MVPKNRGMKIVLNIVKSIALPVAVLVIFTAITGGKYAEGNLLLTIARQAVIPLLIAMAMSAVMLMGMLDFSAGAVVYASAILGTQLAQLTGTGIPGIVVGALLVALALTAISGILYNLMKVPSIVLSIGLLIIYEVLPRLIVPNGTSEIPMNQNILVMAPWCFIILAVMFIVYYIVLNYTSFGYSIRAMGANQTIAYNAGVNISAVKFKAYLFGGLFLGVAGALYMFQGIRVSSATNMSSIGVIFDAIMGVFLALVLSRFCGFAFGLMIGTVTMKMLGTGLVTCGFSPTVRSICTGLFLLVILAYAANQGRLGAWRKRNMLAAAANGEFNAGSNK